MNILTHNINQFNIELIRPKSNHLTSQVKLHCEYSTTIVFEFVVDEHVSENIDFEDTEIAVLGDSEIGEGEVHGG